jgi:hypothetical protein
MTWACGPTPTPTPGDRCEEWASLAREEQERIPEELAGLDLQRPPYKDLMYMPQEIILSGPADGIDRVVARLEEEFDLPLKEISETRLALGETGVGVLYSIPDDRTVEEVLCRVDALGAELGVAPDPNYYLSPAGEWAGGASPWTQNGEWAIPGLRGGLAVAGAGRGDGERLFKEQWALGLRSGIGLYDESENRIPRGDGEGVRVGIFDTSPFGGAGEETVGALKLLVSHPALRPAPGCPGIDVYTGRSLENQDISNHGLFVAGLVHEVAPASEIHLVRVLEDDGCGSLFSIAEEIQAFVRQAVEEAPAGVVVNLSLGVHQPREPERFGLVTERELEAESGQPGGVQFLEGILRWADEQGAVIVAAAGNDSFAEPADAPRGMELPAAYDFVIGVAASNSDRARGCFSNAAPGAPNVAAPGGDGMSPATGAASPWPCVLPTCSDADHEACLVSLSLDSDTGYVYWVGTSFAAPLVTGQVAVTLSRGVSVPVAMCPSADPAHLGEIGYLAGTCP